MDFNGAGNDTEVSTTITPPWLGANTIDVRWAISTRIDPCRWGHRPPTANRPHHQLWFADNPTGSWALARYDRTGGPYQICQYGSRRLWDEIEAAYQWWCAQGTPSMDRWRIVISSDRQIVTLA